MTTQATSRQEIIHRRAVMAAGLIVVFALIVTAATQLTGSTKDYEPQSAPVATAELVFADEADGAVGVYDAATGVRLIGYESNEGAFIRVVMRSVARQRRMRDQGPETPVRLSRLTNGELWLEDPASGAQIYLGAFGHDNAAAFAEILNREEAVRTARTQGGA